jgi:hypothetical protein
MKQEEGDLESSALNAQKAVLCCCDAHISNTTTPAIQKVKAGRYTRKQTVQ